MSAPYQIGDHGMDEESEERAARKESLLRDVNEGIVRGRWPGDGESVRLRCECERLDCIQPIELTLPAYERLRENSSHFVLVAGHENPEVETVVDSGGGYVIVEKQDVAGEVADRLDPRG